MNPRLELLTAINSRSRLVAAPLTLFFENDSMVWVGGGTEHFGDGLFEVLTAHTEQH
jgi:hypothetical protein